MRIVYTIGENIKEHSGLKNKITGQARMWRELGHDVILALHNEGKVMDVGGNVLHSDEVLGRKYAIKSGMLNKAYRLHRLKRQYAFLENVLSIYNPDIVYGRYALPYINAKRAHAGRGKYIIEINSNDVDEYYHNNRVLGLYNKIFRKGLVKQSAGLVFVTRELSLAKEFEWYKGAKTVIGNGIKTNGIEFVSETGNEKPKLCFVGSLNQKWHGVEKIGVLASIIVDCEFHIVGYTKEDYRMQGGMCRENIYFYGRKGEKQTKEIVSKMDIGISTLSLYKTNMEEACPLKSRLYFSLGLPVIGAYKDTDIEQARYYLRISNRRNNVREEADSIRRYIDDVFRNKEVRVEARNFAENVLDIKVKERKRMKYFEDIMS